MVCTLFGVDDAWAAHSSPSRNNRPRRTGCFCERSLACGSSVATLNRVDVQGIGERWRGATSGNEQPHILNVDWRVRGKGSAGRSHNARRSCIGEPDRLGDDVALPARRGDLRKPQRKIDPGDSTIGRVLENSVEGGRGASKRIGNEDEAPRIHPGKGKCGAIRRTSGADRSTGKEFGTGLKHSCGHICSPWWLQAFEREAVERREVVGV